MTKIEQMTDSQRDFAARLWKQIHTEGYEIEQWNDLFDTDPETGAVTCTAIATKENGRKMVEILLGIRSQIREEIDPTTFITKIKK